MFSRPQRLRRFAAYVLLVWLFGLGTTVVNACVAQSIQGQAASSVTIAADDGRQAGQSSQVLEADDDDQDCHHSRPPCERLCDGPSAVTQAEKQQSNPLSGFWLASTPVPSFSFESWAEPSGIVPAYPAGWSLAVPIPIAFLRLAL